MERLYGNAFFDGEILNLLSSVLRYKKTFRALLGTGLPFIHE